MSEIHHLPLSEPIIVSDSPSVSALYSNGSQPWNSVEDFKSSAEGDTLVDTPQWTTILVEEQNGVMSEYWDRYNPGEFVKKVNIVERKPAAFNTPGYVLLDPHLPLAGQFRRIRYMRSGTSLILVYLKIVNLKFLDIALLDLMEAVSRMELYT